MNNYKYHYKLYSFLAKLIVISITLLLVVFINFNSVIFKVDSNYLTIEAEDALSVTEPLHIKDAIGASGGKMLTCSNVHKNNSGMAKYEIYVPQTGIYYFWGRCFWPNACANQFKLLYNNKIYNYANNATYNQWHWVRSEMLEMNTGLNELFILSSDEDAQIDKFLLTMDPGFIPNDSLKSEVYLDFNNGNIAPLNISNSTNWHVIYDSVSSMSYLEGTAYKPDIICLIPNTLDKEYIFKIAARYITSDIPNFAILVNYNDSNDFSQIILRDTCLLYQIRQLGITHTICNIKGDFFNTNWQAYQIIKRDNNLHFKINGKTVFCNELENKTLPGGIGFKLSGGKININYIALLKPKAISVDLNFHNNNKLILERNNPDITPDPFLYMRSGNHTWQIVGGNWERIGHETECLKGNVEKESDNSIILFGDDDWNNYRFSATVKIYDPEKFGLCFRYSDLNNYHVLKWSYVENGHCIRQLIKYCNGTKYILYSDNAIFNINCWYNMEVQSSDGLITTMVNGDTLCSIVDSTNSMGKLGFYNSSQQGALFDDIYVNSISNSSSSTSGNIKEYIFLDNGSVARSLSDWQCDSQSEILPFRHKGNGWFYIDKPLFEPVELQYNIPVDNDFSIKIETSELPKDVDFNIEFLGINTRVNHLVSCKYDQVDLESSNEVIISEKAQFICRKQIQLLRKNDIWQVYYCGTEILNHKFITNSSPEILKLSYTGIGSGHVIIRKIIIYDN